MEITFVGMYADTSPACVSMIGRAVKDPPPNSSDTLAARSNKMCIRDRSLTYMRPTNNIKGGQPRISLTDFLQNADLQTFLAKLASLKHCTKFAAIL